MINYHKIILLSNTTAKNKFNQEKFRRNLREQKMFLKC